jgi:diaminopimelate epimerase
VIPFVKMHGIGNDFVCLDLIQDPLPRELAVARLDWPELAISICHRRFGVGADGILVIERGQMAPFRMRMFNPDGTEAEMCGNGTRCVGRFLVDHGYASPGRLDLEVFGRVVQLTVLPDLISVDMGPAAVLERGIDLPHALRGTSVEVGNPHLVIRVDDVEAVPLKKWGPEMETLPQFPNGTNVHFYQGLGDSELRMRTWERGAGATLACGSGACAVAAAHLGRPGKLHLHLPGGPLWLEIDERGHANMTGAAVEVFQGEWDTAVPAGPKELADAIQ